MKLEQQICTAAQAKRLKELGIFQLVIHRWHSNDGIGFKLLYNGSIDFISSCCTAAFTVAELGVMLPEYISGKDELSLRLTQWCMDDRKSFRLQYRERMGSIREHDLPNEFIDAKTEAEARAALLIYLLENNHITPAEVNQRLQQ